MRPGINWSLPAPFDAVQIVDVEEIRTIDIPTGKGEKLVLTGDQNIVDLAYSVRWNIRDAALYKFQLVDPEQTIREEIGRAHVLTPVTNEHLVYRLLLEKKKPNKNN